MKPETSLSVASVAPCEIPVVMMTQEDAEFKTENIRTLLRKIDETSVVARRVLYEIQSREGWRALGYADFVSYAREEFKIGKTHTYRLAVAGKMEQLLSGEQTLTQSEVAELSRLPDNQVAFVWEQANASGKRPKPAELKNWVNIALGIKPKKKRKAKAAGATTGKPESVQIILKPSLGTSEAKWKPKAAEGITLICQVNRDTDLNVLIQGIDAEKIATQIEEAIATLYAQAVPNARSAVANPDATYAATLPLATHSDY